MNDSAEMKAHVEGKVVTKKSSVKKKSTVSKTLYCPVLEFSVIERRELLAKAPDVVFCVCEV